MENMFIKATKIGLRFDTVRGLATIEDVWQMPLTAKNGFSLDDLAKSLNKQLKESAGESFVEEQSTQNTELDLAFEIVKFIIADRKAENAARLTAAEDKNKRAKILEILSKKKDSAMEEMSVDELEALLKK